MSKASAHHPTAGQLTVRATSPPVVCRWGRVAGSGRREKARKANEKQGDQDELFHVTLTQPIPGGHPASKEPRAFSYETDHISMDLGMFSADMERL